MGSGATLVVAPKAGALCRSMGPRPAMRCSDWLPRSMLVPQVTRLAAWRDCGTSARQRELIGTSDVLNSHVSGDRESRDATVTRRYLALARTSTWRYSDAASSLLERPAYQWT